jgi:pre-mRNA-splicing factor 38A
VFNSRFWKEECFALNAESLIEKAAKLQYAGFSFGAFNRPTPFLCLLVKTVQISPSIDILQSYIDFSNGEPSNNPIRQVSDLRYLRLLAVVHIRLLFRPEAVFSMLEPMLHDYRTIIVLDPLANFQKVTIDGFVEELLSSKGQPVYGFHFPHLTRRSVIQAKGYLGEYRSPLEEELGTSL